MFKKSPQFIKIVTTSQHNTKLTLLGPSISYILVFDSLSGYLWFYECKYVFKSRKVVY